MAEKHVDLHKHAHKHTQIEKVVQDALPSYAIRYEEAFFPVENQEKKAQRCALRAPHYTKQTSWPKLDFLFGVFHTDFGIHDGFLIPDFLFLYVNTIRTY